MPNCSLDCTQCKGIARGIWEAMGGGIIRRVSEDDLSKLAVVK